jgi:hypothetical protein
MRFTLGQVIPTLGTIVALDEAAQSATVRQDTGESAVSFVQLAEAVAAATTPAEPLPARPRNRSMVEGAETSLDDRMSAVRNAVQKAYSAGPGEYCYVEVVFDDYVIVRKSGASGKRDSLWKVTYTAGDDGTVSLGDTSTQVKVAYVPLKEGEDAHGQVFGPIEEAGATTPTGKRWNVLLIQEGMSSNRKNYGRKALREAVDLYRGARMYLDHEESARRFGRSVKDIAGFITDPKPVLLSTAHEAEDATGAGMRFGIAGTAVVTKPEVREALLDAWQEGQVDLFGLSHVAEGEATAVMGPSGPFHDVTRITKVTSVDFVTNPAAGGRVLRLVASDSPLHEDLTMLQSLIEAITASGRADLIAKLQALGATPTAEAVIAIHAEAIKAPPVAAAPAPQPPAGATQVGPTVTLEEAELLEMRRDGLTHFLEAALAGCSLPDAVKGHLRKRFSKTLHEAKARTGLPSKDDITAAIAEQVEVVGALVESKVMLPAPGLSRIEITKTRRDQLVEAFDAFFGVKQDGGGVKLLPNPKLTSFRGLYVDFTGDSQVTGQLREATRLTEALDSTSFDQILGDSITRRMVAEYQLASQAQWRGTIADVVPVSDFRTQRRMRFGGYPNLATVGQGAPYPSMASPSDEEATYAPAKRGGTEQVTIEMIANDDVGAIRRIPQRLARAASQTLYEFVFDFMRTNAVVYDAVALAAAGHGNNISTTALSSAELITLRTRIKTQTDMSNGKRLGLSAKYLWVPTELEELAFQLTMSAKALPDSNVRTTAEPAAGNFVQKVGIEARVVDYWTDTNNYWLTTDISQTPMIEIGFWGGKEEPELFVQDQPNVGSLFSNDQITYKLRHVYGGAVLDYRGFAGGIVP